MVLAGSDFPDDVLRMIEGWGMTMLVEKKANRASTRGLLQYEDDEFGSKSRQPSLVDAR